MADCSIASDQFTICVLRDGADCEPAVEIELAVFVTLAVDDHALKRLGAAIGFHVDEYVRKAVAGRRPATTQAGFCRQSRKSRNLFGKRIIDIGSAEELSEPGEEYRLGDLRRPRLPWLDAGWSKQGILVERIKDDLEAHAHFVSGPADDVMRFARRRETVGMFMADVGIFGPCRQSIAFIDGRLQATVQPIEFGAEMRFQRRETVPSDHELGRVMKELAQRLAGGERSFGLAQGQYGEGGPGDAQRPIPTRIARPTVG